MAPVAYSYSSCSVYTEDLVYSNRRRDAIFMFPPSETSLQYILKHIIEKCSRLAVHIAYVHMEFTENYCVEIHYFLYFYSSPFLCKLRQVISITTSQILLKIKQTHTIKSQRFQREQYPINNPPGNVTFR